MFHLVRGTFYLIVLEASFSFLYTSLVTMFTYIVLIFDIYIYDICLFHLPLHMLFLFSLYTRVSLLYAIFYFCFTLRCLDEFCLKCFRNTGCQNLPYHELFSCKIFQEFVLGILLYLTSDYELSDLWLLSYFICLLWFCHELLKGEIVRTYVEHVMNICHLELDNLLTKCTLLVIG